MLTAIHCLLYFLLFFTCTVILLVTTTFLKSNNGRLKSSRLELSAVRLSSLIVETFARRVNAYLFYFLTSEDSVLFLTFHF